MTTTRKTNKPTKQNKHTNKQIIKYNKTKTATTKRLKQKLTITNIKINRFPVK